MENTENQQTENSGEIKFKKVKTVKQDLGNIQLSNLINPNTGNYVICIFQSNKTIFLEIDKLNDFLTEIEKIK